MHAGSDRCHTRRRQLVGFQIGIGEGAQSWRELLVDVKGRGLKIAPDLVVADGALGFWKALEELLPAIPPMLGAQDSPRSQQGAKVGAGRHEGIPARNLSRFQQGLGRDGNCRLRRKYDPRYPKGVDCLTKTRMRCWPRWRRPNRNPASSTPSGGSASPSELSR
ncbi:MAG: hypothetical protein E5Y82_31300 [Mesorhizobium sp.]|nr:MAG: hypothetical protein E5Y82_31300 [Mesorhizobium sp.]